MPWRASSSPRSYQDSALGHAVRAGGVEDNRRVRSSLHRMNESSVEVGNLDFFSLYGSDRKLIDQPQARAAALAEFGIPFVQAGHGYGIGLSVLQKLRNIGISRKRLSQGVHRSAIDEYPAIKRVEPGTDSNCFTFPTCWHIDFDAVGNDDWLTIEITKPLAVPGCGASTSVQAKSSKSGAAISSLKAATCCARHLPTRETQRFR